MSKTEEFNLSGSTDHTDESTLTPDHRPVGHANRLVHGEPDFTSDTAQLMDLLQRIDPACLPPVQRQWLQQARDTARHLANQVVRHHRTTSLSDGSTAREGQVLLPLLEGKHWLYLTLDGCQCAPDMEAATAQLGMTFQLLTYPDFPPSPRTLLQQYGDHVDYVCLCTSQLPVEQLDQWLSAARWSLAGGGCRIKSLLLYHTPPEEQEPRRPGADTRRPVPTFQAIEQLPQVMHLLLHPGERTPVETAPEPTLIRVLLVEDCRLVRLGIRTVLNETATIDVVGEVDSGESALQVVQALRPDVVLIAIGLPGMTGIETITRIQALATGCRFIVLTSHETDAEVMAAMAAGATAFCLKNISSHRLAEVIATVHEGATWLDPALSQLTIQLFRDGAQTRESGGHDLRKRLAHRELKTLCLLASGKSNNEIAAELFVSVHTAKFYVSNLLEKLGVTDRVQAAVVAAKAGLI